MDVYCKKASSGGRRERDMVASPRTGRAIGGRKHACEIAKIVNEVRLVGVAMLGRDRRPVNSSLAAYRAHDALQPAYAGKPLWREAYPFAEAPHESLRQHPHTRASLGHGHSAIEEGYGSRNCRVPRQDNAFQEHSFKLAQLVCGRGRLTQSLAEQTTIQSPDIVEFNDPVARLADGHAKKCRSSAHLEFHRDQPPLLPGVDGDASPVRARQYRATEPMDGSAIRAAVRPKLIFIQIDHQVRLARG